MESSSSHWVSIIMFNLKVENQKYSLADYSQMVANPGFSISFENQF